MRIQELIDEASALPFDERAQVIESLLKSLNPPEKGVDGKWADVAQSRLNELESGQVNAVSGKAVFRKIQSRLGRFGVSFANPFDARW